MEFSGRPHVGAFVPTPVLPCRGGRPAAAAPLRPGAPPVGLRGPLPPPAATPNRVYSTPRADLRPALESLQRRVDIPTPVLLAAMDTILSGKAPAEGIGALLAGLSIKGESPAEVAAIATSMRARMVPVTLGESVLAAGGALDIVGTGGDNSGSVNISTGAAVVAAAAGCIIAKHGNRSASSKAGSADVLEALGVPLLSSPSGVAACVAEAGIGFMFAPAHHPAMVAVRPARSALGIRTVFNLLGPLLNPAGAGISSAVVGVWSPDVIDVMAAALAAEGTLRRGLVVHTDGLDEFSTAGVAEVAEFGTGDPNAAGGVRRYRFDAAAACGLRRATVEDLRGGDAAHNAMVLCEVWRGERDDAIADAIALNAGVGVYASGGAPTIEAGVRRAQEVMASGDAMRVMDAWRTVALREANAAERAAVGA
ncbi:hypothetical protein MMPV_007417 [Pyropia vietnamensis]